MRNLQFYINAFKSLNVSKRDGFNAPHKAILLLSVINFIEGGAFDDNKVFLNKDLELAFSNNWRKYVGKSDTFKCNIAAPFLYMSSEPFWSLQKKDSFEENKNYSLVDLKLNVEYAEVDQSLFTLLQDPNNSALLRVLLICEYVAPLHNKRIKLSQSAKREALLSNDIEIIDYSDRSIIVVGDTRLFKDQFKLVGGLYNPRIYNGKPAWIFSKRKRNEVETIVNNDDPINTSKDGEQRIFKNSEPKTNCSISQKSKIDEWQNNAKGYLWVKGKLQQGWTNKDIVESFNKLHLENPKDFSTRNGMPLSASILSHWTRQMFPNADYTNKSTKEAREWRQSSIGYNWVRKMTEANVSDEDIIKQFNHRHEIDPNNYSTRAGEALSLVTLIRWKREFKTND